MDFFLADWTLSSRATHNDISLMHKDFGLELPSDYVEFLLNNGSGEGFVGKNYLIIWNSHEIIEFNSSYEVEKYAPGLIVFGSSGGGEAYGFDTREALWSVVSVPFVGMSLNDVLFVADSFSEFIIKLGVSDDGH